MEDRAQVSVLPPLIPLAAFLLGLVVHLIYPVGFGAPGLRLTIGFVIAAVSIVLVVAARGALAKAKTAFDIRKPTTTLVKSGAFRVSRNPVYLALMLLCFAIALILDSLAPTLFLLPAGSLLCVAVIRPEEKYLEGKFGEAYLTYKASVPRWL